MRLNALLAGAASLLLAGCVQGTLNERNASAYTHLEVNIGPTEGFLVSRTALLISGEHLKITPSATNRGDFSQQSASKALGIASATAVDRRGYFLTAAHALKNEPQFLLFWNDNRLQVERPCVVWRGDRAKEEPDLALLCVPCTLGEVFEWASNFKVGDQVIAVGPNQRPTHIESVCFTGRVLDCATDSRAQVCTRAIFHNAALHTGDSGGPLVALDGRLLGINVKMSKVFSLGHPLGKRMNRADCPDLPWLHQLIERHAGTQTGASSQNPNPRAGCSSLASSAMGCVAKTRRMPCVFLLSLPIIGYWCVLYWSGFLAD